jgi:diguanylate cyclase (GGDEF)-like protein
MSPSENEVPTMKDDPLPARDVALSVADAHTPVDALATLYQAGRDDGLEAWLCAAPAEHFCGYAYSGRPMAGSLLQGSMAELAGQFAAHAQGADCSPVGHVFPVQEGCAQRDEPATHWHHHRDYEVRIAGEIAGLLRVGSLSHDRGPNWRRAQDLVALASPYLAYLITRGVHGSASGLLDPVTGLYSAAYFDDQLKREVERAASYYAELCLMVVDITPRGGGPAAIDDVAMRLVAQVLASQTRRTDFGARLGASRFALLMPQTGARDALSAAGRLEKEILAADSLSQAYKVYIGISGWNLQGPDEGELFRQADEAARLAAAYNHEGPFLYV